MFSWNWWTNFLRSKLFPLTNEQSALLHYELNSSYAIELQNISMIKQDLVLLDYFNYKFKKNTVYSIIGPSGAGKSILAEHFNGLSKSPTGNVHLFNGEKILFFRKKIKNYQKIRKTVGMVLQFPEYQLFKDTVIEDVCYGLKMLGCSEEEAITKSSQKLIELGIGKEFFGSNPFMLSGGQKRKVALSGILAINPEIIIFDEPTIGLDPYSENNIISLIKDLKKQNKTIVIISHNMNLVLELSDVVLILDKGKLIDAGDPYDLFRNQELPIGKPKIVDFVQKLNNLSPKFNYLWCVKPRNIEDLAKAIKHVVSK